MAFCRLVELVCTATLMTQAGEANAVGKAAVYTNARSFQSPRHQKQKVNAAFFSHSRYTNIFGI